MAQDLTVGIAGLGAIGLHLARALALERDISAPLTCPA